MRDIKSRFFALRNGMIADRLRKAGSPYKIIFGLLIPQIEQVASRYEASAVLAEMLWNNVSTRESRIMATMVFPPEEFTKEKARQWIGEADTEELADQLCFRLVRRLNDAERIAAEWYRKGDDMCRYSALRLLMNLMVLGRLQDQDAAYGMAVAESARDCRMTKAVCRQVADEIEWLRTCAGAER